jgi:hypothetical protein
MVAKNKTSCRLALCMSLDDNHGIAGHPQRVRHAIFIDNAISRYDKLKKTRSIIIRVSVVQVPLSLPNLINKNMILMKY